MSAYGKRIQRCAILAGAGFIGPRPVIGLAADLLECAHLEGQGVGAGLQPGTGAARSGGGGQALIGTSVHGIIHLVAAGALGGIPRERNLAAARICGNGAPAGYDPERYRLSPGVLAIALYGDGRSPHLLVVLVGQGVVGSGFQRGFSAFYDDRRSDRLSGIRLVRDSGDLHFRDVCRACIHLLLDSHRFRRSVRRRNGCCSDNHCRHHGRGYLSDSVHKITFLMCIGVLPSLF